MSSVVYHANVVIGTTATLLPNNPDYPAKVSFNRTAWVGDDTVTPETGTPVGGGTEFRLASGRTWYAVALVESEADVTEYREVSVVTSGNYEDLLGKPTKDIKGLSLSESLAASNKQAVEDAVAEATAGDVLVVPIGNWPIDAAITVNKAVYIVGHSASSRIRQITSDKQAFIVTSSGVSFRNLRISGPQNATVRTTERGIQAVGTVGTPLEDLSVQDCEIDNWGSQGIRFEYVNNTKIKGNYFHDINNSGCTILSGIEGVFLDNKIVNITGTSPCYGLALTMLDDTVPRSSDWLVKGNVVDGCVWEGLETHAGRKISFIGNIVKNCERGIFAVIVGTLACLDILIEDNIVDSGSTAGDKDAGIFIGGTGSAGSPGQLSTGIVKGNLVRGHSKENISTGGAILFYSTVGLVISGNTVIEPGYNGICLYYNNYGYVLEGNTVIDPWSNTASTGVAFHVRSTFNKGSISGNAAVRGSKTAAGVLAQGIRIFVNDVSNVTVLGSNYLTEATTAVLDAGTASAGAEARLAAKKTGFYGVTPVARAAAIASPSADSASLKTAVDAIRVALTNMGITS